MQNKKNTKIIKFLKYYWNILAFFLFAIMCSIALIAMPNNTLGHAIFIYKTESKKIDIQIIFDKQVVPNDGVQWGIYWNKNGQEHFDDYSSQFPSKNNYHEFDIIDFELSPIDNDSVYIYITWLSLDNYKFIDNTNLFSIM